MFLHDAKHRVSQEMLSCDIAFHADGIYDANENAFFRSEGELRQLGRKDSITGCVGIIVWHSHLQRLFEARQQPNMSSKRWAETVPGSEVFACSEMVIVAQPADIEWKAISFQTPPLHAGRATLLVGPYVGPYTYAIAALRKVRNAFQTPLFKLLGQEPPGGCETCGNVFLGMTGRDVERLDHFGVTFDNQQRMLADSIGRRPEPLIPIRVVCGAGKSVLLVGLTLWAHKDLEEGQAVACLAPNRNQREQMVRSLRRHLQPDDVMSLGRPEDGSTGETDTDFDSFVERRIASEFSADLAELKALADELSVYKTNLEMTTVDGQRWMSQTTEMAKKAFEYWRKKEGFVSSLYRHVKIWCFTVDCFL